jgi:hypothetical protein
VAKPCWQAMRPIASAKAALFNSPDATSVGTIARLLSLRYAVAVIR